MIDISVEKHGSTSVMHIQGKFYTDSIEKVKNIWNALVNESPHVIAIDCRELRGVDSSAVGTMVLFLNFAMDKNIKLVFYDLSPEVKKVFNAAKLNSFFTITTKRNFERQFFSFSLSH
ncbi:MAG: hypothetical protein CVV44_20010 [Spirochaetae bacterium HGW-Spirochaetae-1]|jgi:anti-anti-sigma factor|nr:MAG: hypothetical protein CVV44_20010 [Spirochaetae bacterium HGW-Spirochaetae-1]